MKPFPWRPGMRATTAQRLVCVLAVRDGMALCAWDAGVPGAEQARSAWVALDALTPDRADPTTLGALLGVVREVYGVAGCPRAAEIYIQPQTNDVGWVVFRRGRPSDTCGGLGGPPKWKPLAIGSTEFDALLAAYEAAP